MIGQRKALSVGQYRSKKRGWYVMFSRGDLNRTFWSVGIASRMRLQGVIRKERGKVYACWDGWRWERRNLWTSVKDWLFGEIA